MDLKELRKIYDDKKIDEIEALAKNASAAQEAQLKQFIGVLFYLDSTKRYKENVAYKSSSFAEYITSTYGMSPQTYERYRFAYFKYEKQSDEFGVGTIMKIVNKAGRESVPMVVKELKKVERPTPEKTSAIIEKFAKPRLKARAKDRAARPSRKDLERENLELKAKIRELMALNNDLMQQNEKLKATVRRYESGIARLVPVPINKQAVHSGAVV